MLTKTDFIQHFYKGSPIELWARAKGLYNPPPSEHERFIMTQGQKVESLAQVYLSQTLGSSERVEFQVEASDTKNGLFARADAILKHPQGVHLVEIKSGTRVKQHYLADLAFQAIVFENEGQNINRLFLIHIDPEYRHNGQLDIKTFFIKVDVTTKVREMIPEVRSQIDQALKVLRKKDIKSIEGAESLRHQTELLDLVFEDLPEYSIFHLNRLRSDQIKELLDKNILDLKEIPPDFPLTQKQRLQIEATRTGQPIIDKSQLNQQLQSLEFPLAFLDYETFGALIPEHKRYKPNTPQVFQYSLHILDKDGQLVHKEFIAQNQDEPSAQLLKQLKQDMPESGSILVWYQPFESGRNRDMALLHPQYKEFLLTLNSRMFDLMIPFRSGAYVHPEARGSNSIKNVLPALVPQLSYQDLSIKKGDQASLVWHQLVHGTLSPKHSQKTINDLLAYCGLDTLAMVEIYKHCQEILSL